MVLKLHKRTFRGGVHPMQGLHEGKLPTKDKPVREFMPETVCILMGMHLGAPSKPCVEKGEHVKLGQLIGCLLYTSPSPRDRTRSRMPSSA